MSYYFVCYGEDMHIMFNLGASAENVTHLKNGTLFFVW